MSLAADDLQRVAGRGLVFERFFEIGGTRAQFVEQPSVLHRNDRLRGEAFQERDLFLGERPWPQDSSPTWCSFFGPASDARFTSTLTGLAYCRSLNFFAPIELSEASAVELQLCRRECVEVRSSPDDAIVRSSNFAPGEKPVTDDQFDDARRGGAPPRHWSPPDW